MKTNFSFTFPQLQNSGQQQLRLKAIDEIRAFYQQKIVLMQELKDGSTLLTSDTSKEVADLLLAMKHLNMLVKNIVSGQDPTEDVGIAFQKLHKEIADGIYQFEIDLNNIRRKQAE